MVIISSWSKVEYADVACKWEIGLAKYFLHCNMLISLGWLYSDYNLYIPFVSHFLAGISLPCPHLLNRGSLWPECIFTIWPKKDLNFAQITSPLPLNVDVALQCRWFAHGLIHPFKDSQPFSLAIFESTFYISGKIDHEHVTKIIQLHTLPNQGR